MSENQQQEGVVVDEGGDVASNTVPANDQDVNMQDEVADESNEPSRAIP